MWKQLPPSPGERAHPEDSGIFIGQSRMVPPYSAPQPILAEILPWIRTSSGNHLNGRLELRVLRRVQCMVLQLLFLLLRKLQLPVPAKARPYERNAPFR